MTHKFQGFFDFFEYESAEMQFHLGGEKSIAVIKQHEAPANDFRLVFHNVLITTDIFCNATNTLILRGQNFFQAKIIDDDLMLYERNVNDLLEAVFILSLQKDIIPSLNSRFPEEINLFQSISAPGSLRNKK